MSEKAKNFVAPAPKNLKPKRLACVASTSASSSRSRILANAKIRPAVSRTSSKSEGSLPEFDAEYRQIAYGKFLRAMLEECLVEEKIEREETELDVQMSQLADRLDKTMNQLDKTNVRVKQLRFVGDQKRLLDLKSTDNTKFHEMTGNTNVRESLKNLCKAEGSHLDCLEVKNVDFGYNKISGHTQLLDAVNECLEGIENIKQHSSLDITKLKEYEEAQMSLDELQKKRFDLETLKSDFEEKFPGFGEKLLKEVSDRMASIENE